MEIQRLFRKSIVLQISEIERVEIGKKNQLLLYASGKKLITIDFLTENYEYLEETLRDYEEKSVNMIFYDKNER